LIEPPPGEYTFFENPAKVEPAPPPKSEGSKANNQDCLIMRVKDFFVNEREFIIYHQHKQQTCIEDLLMEAPDEEIQLPTLQNVLVPDAATNLNHSMLNATLDNQTHVSGNTNLGGAPAILGGG
jgi:hypothetical protein